MITKSLNKISKAIKNPYIVLAKLIEGRARFISDKKYLEIFYRASFGTSFNWDNPITYNQKLQWLKIHDRNPVYKKLVDKYEVRKIVSSLIGEQYLIPILGAWDAFDDIDFDKLPSQFVLKCTHDSGGVVICKDKTKFNVAATRYKINKHMKQDFFWYKREWPYKDIKPKIIAEKFMEDESYKELKDFKLFMFYGEPKMLFVASDRNKSGENVKFDYFDINFTKLILRQTAHENSNYKIEKPRNFDDMIEIAKTLSKGIPHVRIDLYNINGSIYFGEYTFFHHSGLVPFIPAEYDALLGKLLPLDK